MPSLSPEERAKVRAAAEQMRTFVIPFASGIKKLHDANEAQRDATLTMEEVRAVVQAFKLLRDDGLVSPRVEDVGHLNMSGVDLDGD